MGDEWGNVVVSNEIFKWQRKVTPRRNVRGMISAACSAE